MHAGEPLSTALDEVLADLPVEFVVATDGDDARLVVGPAGAFVLVPLPAARTARDDAARRVHLLAQETRAELGEHLAWVPFLDALLVSTGPLLRGAGVTVAPVDLLAAVLRDGPLLIDGPTLASVDRIVARRDLGHWRSRAAAAGPGPGAADGRIELCHLPHPPPASRTRRAVRTAPAPGA